MESCGGKLGASSNPGNQYNANYNKELQPLIICLCAVPENIHTHAMEGQWKF